MEENRIPSHLVTYGAFVNQLTKGITEVIIGAISTNAVNTGPKIIHGWEFGVIKGNEMVLAEVKKFTVEFQQLILCLQDIL